MIILVTFSLKHLFIIPLQIKKKRLCVCVHHYPDAPKLYECSPVAHVILWTVMHVKPVLLMQVQLSISYRTYSMLHVSWGARTRLSPAMKLISDNSTIDSHTAEKCGALYWQSMLTVFLDVKQQPMSIHLALLNESLMWIVDLLNMQNPQSLSHAPEDTKYMWNTKKISKRLQFFKLWKYEIIANYNWMLKDSLFLLHVHVQIKPVASSQAF